MKIVLGVSMTPTTVRMVLVEGENADGVTVDHDVFDIVGIDGAANSSASDQVIAAILGTRESADAGAHRLHAAGVTWSDHREAAKLREALTARRIEDVLLVSELHAAGALAQAAGRAVGHDRTAVIFIERDTATASVVATADGSIVKVDSRSLHSTDAMDVLTDMATSVESGTSQPEGIFLLGSGVDIGALKQHLENHVTIPVSAPEDPEMALARGAALAAANAPTFDAATVGLAYSQDPDGITAGEAYPAEDVSTEGTQAVQLAAGVREDRKPFMLVGTSLTAIFVVGVVALVISLAVSIRPTVGSRPNPGQDAAAAAPPAAAPPPAALNPQPAAQPAAPPAAAPPAPPAPPPVAETIAPPVPVVQQQPLPRKVVAQAPAPEPAALAPAPQAPPPAPAPEAPPPAPVYVPPPAPVYAPPQAPVYAPPQAPVVGLPPFIGFGPGPSSMPGVRGSDPRWYPPQQQWPGPGSDVPGGYGPGSGSYAPGPGSYGSGPGSYGPGPGSYDPGSGSPGHSGRSPLWPWPLG
jgi:hypothetical protein